MRLKFAIGLLTLVIFTAHGQERKLTADSDTIYWKNYYGTIFKQVGIAPIKSTDNESTFRFWDGKKLIELRNSKDSIKAAITFIVKEYKERKEGKRKSRERNEGRLYFRSWVLTAETARQLNQLLEVNHISEIPTYGQIEGWNIGLDGRTYILEYADKDILSFKNYWSPDFHKDKLKEAKRMTDFIEGIKQIAEIDILHGKFMNMQPFGRWYTFIGSATVGSQNMVIN